MKRDEAVKEVMEAFDEMASEFGQSEEHKKQIMARAREVLRTLGVQESELAGK
jgi:hypothetical protein